MAKSKERINYLLGVWTSRKATPSEEKELFDWIGENQDEGPVQAHIERLIEEYQPGALMPSVDWESVYETILAGRMKEEAGVQLPQRRSLSYKRWVAAASVILVLGLGAFYWFRKSPAPEQALSTGTQQLVTDALPGRQGAILTLANGEKMVLDSLADSEVTTQGATKVLIRNGQLVYDAKATTGKMLYNTMATPRGRQFQLVLPDGTQVWLNAASSITYPTVFAGNERKVSVSGEAYFEVAKDRSKPFTVNIDNQSEVEVLGTHFNINSYGDDGTIKTTLLEGSIRVRNSRKESVVAKPGQQVQTVLSNRQELVVNSGIDLEQVMAWKNGVFNFNNADLAAVMHQLSRWYDMDVRYEGAVPSRKFKGEITNDLNLSQVLKLLEDVEVKFRIEGKTLFVKP